MITLSTLVKEFLVEVSELTEHKFARYLQYGYSGLRDFNLDTSGSITAVFLTVNSNGTVDLPSDYISFIRLGICGTDGNLHYLGHNPKMCRLSTDDCGDLEKNTGTGSSAFADAEGGHWRNDEGIGRYFGVGGGNNKNGYYKIRSKEGYIELQNFDNGEVWLEYLADISRNSNGEFQVHPYLIEALKDWIQWMSIQRNLRQPANAKEMARRDYLRSKNIAQRRFASFTLEECKSVIRKSFTMFPKY